MQKTSKAKKGIISPQAIVIILIIIALVWFNFGSTGSIGVQGIPVQEEKFNFDGVSGTAQSPFFGTITSDALDENGFKRRSFCGSNDGDATIRNNIQDGQDLILTTSISGSSASCGNGYNYIKSKIVFPAGKLIVNCDLSSKEGNDGISYSNCEIKKDGKLEFTLTSLENVDCNLRNRNLDWRSRNCIPTANKGIEILTKEDTEIEITIKSSLGSTGSAQSNLRLDFIKDVVIMENDSNEDVNGSNLNDTPQSSFSFLEKIINWFKELFA